MEGEKEIFIDSCLNIAGLTLITISETSLNYRRLNSLFYFTGSKRPVITIVITPTDKKAFSISGEEIALPLLIEEFPELEKHLEAM